MPRPKTKKKSQTGCGQPEITRAAAELWIRQVVDAKAALQKQLDALNDVVGVDHNAPLPSEAWRVFGMLERAVGELIGDGNEALSWFLYDNDCGANALQHSMTSGEMKKVETIHDLLDVMGY